jgi:hypothetical protein
MTKTYRDWSTDQNYLFPPSPHDWLPEGDLVYFLLDTVAALDLTPIFAHYERELRGQPPFHPRMMVALLLYCYATGTRSSRRIMKRCHVDVARRAIVGEGIPDFRTIPSPIQYFLPCSMTACALFDPGLIVSNVAHS